MQFKFILILNFIITNYSIAQTDIPFEFYDYSNKIDYRKILSHSVDEKLNIVYYKKLLNLSVKKRDYKNSIKYLEKIMTLNHLMVPVLELQIHQFTGVKIYKIVRKKQKKLKKIFLLHFKKHQNKKKD